MTFLAAKGITGAKKCMKAKIASKVVRTIDGRLDSSEPFIFQGSADVKKRLVSRAASMARKTARFIEQELISAEQPEINSFILKGSPNSTS